MNFNELFIRNDVETTTTYNDVLKLDIHLNIQFYFRFILNVNWIQKSNELKYCKVKLIAIFVLSN